VSEHFQMNTPQKEILCIKPDGSFRVGDGVDPMFALGELANAYMKQRERIKRLEEALAWYESTVSDCNRHGPQGDAARHALAQDRGIKAKEAKP
jgi:hypothetical protein